MRELKGNAYNLVLLIDAEFSYVFISYIETTAKGNARRKTKTLASPGS